MRVLSAIGALFFLYLAVIPAGLLYSTLDSACAGPGCEVSVASTVLFSLLYAACLGALGTTAVLLARRALHASPEIERSLSRALAASAGVVGVTALALFTFAFPAPGIVTLLIGGSVLAVLTARARIERRRHPAG